MSDDVTRVTKVRPGGGRVLRVHFAGDRRDRKLDMTGLIARSAHFAPLMDDAQSFAKVAIVEDGLGLAWPIETKWGRLDVSASTLRVANGTGTVVDRGSKATWGGTAHNHGLSEEGRVAVRRCNRMPSTRP